MENPWTQDRRLGVAKFFRPAWPGFTLPWSRLGLEGKKKKKKRGECYTAICQDKRDAPRGIERRNISLGAGRDAGSMTGWNVMRM